MLATGSRAVKIDIIGILRLALHGDIPIIF